MARHGQSTTLQRLLTKAELYRDGAPLEPTGQTFDFRMDHRLPDHLRLHPRNIFRHLAALQIPNVAYVAGAGPLLLEELRTIPPDSFVIACNRAIQADFKFSAWMVFDLNCKRFQWFRQPPAGDYARIFGHRLQRDHQDAYCFSSRHTDCMHRITPGGLQGGGTIVGCALQLLYWAGCRTAITLGAPMSGSTHFDGTKAQPYNGVWKQAHCCTYYINQMQCGGMTVLAVGQNALGLKLVSEVQDAQTPAS
jgi:hypothetical protein